MPRPRRRDGIRWTDPRVARTCAAGRLKPRLREMESLANCARLQHSRIAGREAPSPCSTAAPRIGRGHRCRRRSLRSRLPIPCSCGFTRPCPSPRTAALPHSRTPALPHFRTPALPHFRTSALPHFRTSALPHSRTSALPHFLATPPRTDEKSRRPRYALIRVPRGVGAITDRVRPARGRSGNSFTGLAGFEPATSRSQVDDPHPAARRTRRTSGGEDSALPG